MRRKLHLVFSKTCWVKKKNLWFKWQLTPRSSLNLIYFAFLQVGGGQVGGVGVGVGKIGFHLFMGIGSV